MTEPTRVPTGAGRDDSSPDGLVEAEGERGFYERCWCSGRKRVWYSFTYLDDRCGGTGTLHCDCGGDFCVCHNHGEVECFGCEDCDALDDDEHGSWDG